MTRFTIREEYVKCGKPGCKSCPHGPYRYKYWREKGVLKKKYLGKPETQELFDEAGEAIHEPIAEQVTPTDREILGVTPDASFSRCRNAYRKWTALYGPRGEKPDAVKYAILKEAWNSIRGNRR